ncbi:MAG: Holliday junction resolvase RuvX [Chlamydiia bacterium]|nr:Holliday junction resolvase RuvX [Chlamydiia bacterium]
MKTRIVGIDWGVKRIGIALSDETKMLATPQPTIIGEKKAADTVKKVLAALQAHAKDYGYQIEKIVVGMPLMLSGKSGLLADEVSHFIKLLKEHTDIEIVAWDERLTTSMAEKSLKESSLSRKKRSKVVDSVAAIIILQSYLDFLGG